MAKSYHLEVRLSRHAINAVDWYDILNGQAENAMIQSISALTRR